MFLFALKSPLADRNMDVDSSFPWVAGFDSVGLGWELRVCISCPLPGDVDAVAGGHRAKL